MQPATPRKPISAGPRPPLRSRPGSVVFTLLLALTAVIALAVFVAMRYVLANPNPTINYASAANQALLANAPQGDNAWPMYRDIIRNRLTAPVKPPENPTRRFTTLQDVLMGRDPELRERHMVLLRMGDWDDPRLAPSKQALEQLRVLLPELDQAAAKPRFVKFYYPGSDALAQTGLPSSGKPAAMLMHILLPELGSMLGLARFNAVAMREAAQKGDWDEVAQRARTGLAMGAQLAQQDTLIEGLVALSMQAITLEEMQFLLNERDIPPGVVQALIESVRAREIPVSVAEDWLDGERLLELDAVQWLYSPQGALLTWQLDSISSSSPAPQPTIGQRLANVVAIAMPSKSRVERDINRFIDAGQDYAQAPLAQRDALARIVDQRASANRIIEMLAPAVSRIVRQFDRLAAERAATILMLRLEQLHAETGAWPESLDAADLGDAALEPATGAPFVYRRLEDDPQGRAYVLELPPALRAVLESRAPVEINPLREALPEPEGAGGP